MGRNRETKQPKTDTEACRVIFNKKIIIIYNLRKVFWRCLIFFFLVLEHFTWSGSSFLVARALSSAEEHVTKRSHSIFLFPPNQSRRTDLHLPPQIGHNVHYNVLEGRKWNKRCKDKYWFDINFYQASRKEIYRNVSKSNTSTILKVRSVNITYGCYTLLYRITEL